METMKQCGHRLTNKQFAKIRKIARTFKIKEAVALRMIIDDCDIERLRMKMGYTSHNDIA